MIVEFSEVRASALAKQLQVPLEEIDTGLLEQLNQLRATIDDMSPAGREEAIRDHTANAEQARVLSSMGDHRARFLLWLSNAVLETVEEREHVQ